MNSRFPNSGDMMFEKNQRFPEEEKKSNDD
jgi:hypothetical protein